MTKMTQKNAIAFVIENYGEKMPKEVLDKVKEVGVALAKKSASKGDRKPTKTQKANEGYKEIILASMEEGRWYTITEMEKSFDFGEELSNQRVSALVRQLKEGNKVIRDVKEGKAVFTLA